MKKYPAIKNFLLSTSLVFYCSTTHSFASETLYLELGKPASIEETEANWRNLSKKYNSLLGKLNFYPKQVVFDGSTKSIIQAGPVSEKRKAQRICNILFGKDIPCFVIEGIEKAPPTISVVMSQALSQSPNTSFVIPQEDLSRDIAAVQQVIASSDTQAAKTTINEENTEDTVENDVEIIESESEQIAAFPPREGDVDVAQAIPVPLSDLSNENRVDVLPQSQQTSQEDSNKKEASLVSFSSEYSGNLIINSFKSENDANSFWKQTSDKRFDLVDGLRVRIQRPLLASSVGNIQMSIGIFENGSAAANFCNNTVFYYESNLRCSYEITNEQFLGTATTAKTTNNIVESTSGEISIKDIPAKPSSQHSDGYEQRRNSLVRRVPAGQAELSRTSQDTATNTQSSFKYWVQVVIADSRSEATRRLEEVKSNNSDLDVNVGSMILTSPSSHGKFTARIGGFSDENEANKLCDNLQLRGVDCLVITTK